MRLTLLVVGGPSYQLHILAENEAEKQDLERLKEVLLKDGKGVLSMAANSESISAQLTMLWERKRV